jgi:hypothetical protein
MCIPFCTGIVYVVAWFNVCCVDGNLSLPHISDTQQDAHHEKENCFLGLNWPGHEADHSPPLLHIFSWHCAELIMYRDNFIFFILNDSFLTCVSSILLFSLHVTINILVMNTLTHSFDLTV